jgi:hypothetical protein
MDTTPVGSGPDDVPNAIVSLVELVGAAFSPRWSISSTWYRHRLPIFFVRFKRGATCRLNVFWDTLRRLQDSSGVSHGVSVVAFPIIVRPKWQFQMSVGLGGATHLNPCYRFCPPESCADREFVL